MIGHRRPGIETRLSSALLLVLTTLGGGGADLTVRTAAQASSGSARLQPGAPQRIVCLIPNVTQMLFSVGAGPQVVGVSSFAHDPPEADRIPKVGGLIDPDTERILALRPDLVIVYASQQELQQRLTGAGVRQFVYKHGDLRDVTRTIRDVGALTGHADRADALAGRIEQDLRMLAVSVAGRDRPQTLLVFGRDPHAIRNVFAQGGYGFLHDMLTIAGGENVFADLAREAAQPSSEQILARAPDVIIELRYGASAATPFDPSPWQRLASLPAVRNRRIYALTGDEFVEGGVRVAEATGRIARLLHPEAFK